MKRLVLTLALGVLAIGLPAAENGSSDGKAACPMAAKTCCMQNADMAKTVAAGCPMKGATCCQKIKTMAGGKTLTLAKVLMSPKAASEARQ